MLSESHFEIEKRRDSWSVSARVLPALGFALAGGAIGVAGALWWISGHIHGVE